MTVARVGELSPRMVEVTLHGPELVGFSVDEPAASVRVLLPEPGTDRLVVPTWTGNEFLLPDGTRPTIRTLTPRHFDAEAGELTVAVVVHGTGAASAWARAAGPGRPAAVSGPGRGYAVPPGAASFLLAGDETALPAIVQLLEALPGGAAVAVHVELAAPDARIPLPERVGATVAWHDLAPGRPPGTALVEAVRRAAVEADTHVWVAGEAAAVQRIRRLLFEERAVPRGRATVRGYWKHGRSAQSGGEG
ncbi:MAG TPA: siderophore-interacting protein [Acidimicrobiales bacterium]|nr:siderophore-interacting protein [Acidimicrobiales bacterium]